MSKGETNPPHFHLYELVRIINLDGATAEIDRKFGAILGMSKNELGNWSYAVAVYEDDKCTKRADSWSIDEKNLAKTGREMKEEDFYDGSSIVVSEDGEQSYD